MNAEEGGSHFLQLKKIIPDNGHNMTLNIIIMLNIWKGDRYVAIVGALFDGAYDGLVAKSCSISLLRPFVEFFAWKIVDGILSKNSIVTNTKDNRWQIQEYFP